MLDKLPSNISSFEIAAAIDYSYKNYLEFVKLEYIEYRSPCLNLTDVKS